MKFKNFTHQVHSCITWLAIFALAMAISLQSTAQTITIDKTVQYQTIEGFGGFGPKKVWWESGPYYDAGYLNQTIDSLGVNIFRTQIYWDGEQANDDANPNTFNWAGFNFGASSDNGKQFPFISALAAKGSKIIGTVWTPPLWMKLFDDPSRIPSECYNCNNCAIGTPARKPCGGSLNPIYYHEFAEYLVAYVKTLKLQTGVDLYGISIQNEPWFANPFEATVVKPAEYADILKIVAQRFEAEGLTTKFFGPEHMAEWSWGIQTQYVNEILGDSTVKPYLDIYAVHSYVDGVTPDYGNAEGWTNLYNNITVAHGKPLWMTETSAGETGYTLAFNMSRALYLALRFGRVTGWIYWYMADAMIVNNVPTKLGYALKNYYRYVRPGAVSVSALSSDPEILPLAFSHETDSATTIVLINNGTTTKTVSIDLSGGIIPAQYTVYRTSATENCINAGVMPASGTIQLPPQSITTLDNRPTDTEAPTVPTGLATSSISFTSLTLTWNASTDNKAVTAYEIFRNGSSIGTSPTPAYNVTGMVAGTAYTFTVRAKDAAGNNSAQSTTLNASTIGNGLIAYWSFDETSGTSVADRSGNGNTGSLNNGASFTSGKTNNGVNLNGSGSWVNIPNKTISGNFTLAAWVNFSGTISSSDALIGQEGSGQCIDFNSARIRFYTGSSTVVQVNQTLAANTWKHYTIRRSGTSISIYIDGVLNATGTYSGSFIPKAIGRGNNGTNTAGKIDEVYLYNRALSATEITNLFGGTAARFIEPVNEGIGDQIDQPSNTDELGIYPNPLTNDKLTLYMYSDEPLNTTLQLMHMDGTTILQKSVILQAGKNSIVIPAGKLSNGIYFIRARKGEKEIIRKMIIKR
jgi:glucuronoarabinoxylan endo-1,4-beta-xylanase